MRQGKRERAFYKVLDASLKMSESGFASVFGPHTKATPSEDARILVCAHKRDKKEAVATWPGTWMRSVGCGRATSLDGDPFLSYPFEPTRTLSEFFARLLTR